MPSMTLPEALHAAHPAVPDGVISGAHGSRVVRICARAADVEGAPVETTRCQHVAEPVIRRDHAKRVTLGIVVAGGRPLGLTLRNAERRAPQDRGGDGDFLRRGAGGMMPEIYQRMEIRQ